MRYIVITTLAFFCMATALHGQTTEKLTIEKATVFLRGAQLQSTARVHLNKGENELVFTNVAGGVNTESITVSATNGPAIASATFQNNYLVTENVTPKTKALKDSIEGMTEARTAIANKIAVLAEQIAILQNNRKVSGDNTGLAVAELTKMLDLVDSRMEGYTNQKSRQEKLLAKADERLANMNRQLGEERKKDVQTGGRLLVKFYTTEAVTSDVTISYVVPGAGWTPSYDIRVDDISKPASLYYKANVYQNSGVKWDNVRLTLSTGNPQEGIDAPTLNPWNLSFYVPPVYPKTAENIATLPTTQVPDVTALSPGLYQSQRGKSVNISGARSSGTLYVIDGVQVQNIGEGANSGIDMTQGTINTYVTADNTGISTSFDIDIPYTIPNDGQQHMVAIKQYELPATYRYYAAPKLDKDVFLQALLTKWEDLNLLPGQTNISYEGTYVGQGYLDMRYVKDTMVISLGRDKKIIVKREQDKKLRSVKSIGANVREAFAYTITVRNTRKQAIDLTLLDQVPVSNDKDISVENGDTGDAVYNETTGQLKWLLHIAPSESKSVPLGYTIKYPKGRQVVNIR